MSEPPKHHQKLEYCTTRPTYREGRKLKAVKVYTVNDESRYILLQGVPAVGATQDLLQLCALYGRILEYRILDEYPTSDDFTDVFWIKYERIQSARVAKRKLDDQSFFGGVLHVCYAPECENVEDTRQKLIERRKTIAAKCREYGYNVSGSALQVDHKQGRQAQQTKSVPLGDLLANVETTSTSEGLSITAPLAEDGASNLETVMPAPSYVSESTSQNNRDGNALPVNPYMPVQWQRKGVAAEQSTWYYPWLNSNFQYPSSKPYPHDWPAPPSVVHNDGIGKPSSSSSSVSCDAQKAAAWQKCSFSLKQSSVASKPAERAGESQLVTWPREVLPPKASATLASGMPKPLTGNVPRNKEEAGAKPTPTLIIKEYQPPTVTRPRFVPRQTFVKVTLGDAPEACTIPATLESLELKRNAAILGKKQGPATLPCPTTDARSLTGNVSIDKTVYEIRSRMRGAASAPAVEASSAKLQRIQRSTDNIS